MIKKSLLLCIVIAITHFYTAELHAAGSVSVENIKKVFRNLEADEYDLQGFVFLVSEEKKEISKKMINKLDINKQLRFDQLNTNTRPIAKTKKNKSSFETNTNNNASFSEVSIRIHNQI